MVTGILITIIGYIVLIIPLTTLTILKQRKKFSSNTDSISDDVFNNTLAKVENVFVLATKSEAGDLTASIVTFKQSASDDNVFFVVTGSDTERTANIAHNGVAAVTTWMMKRQVHGLVQSMCHIYCNQIQAITKTQRLKH